MFLKENILLAITGLKSNKMRSFLTMLGIIIGIGSVIAIVSIGDALKQSISSKMTSMGVNTLYVYVAQKGDDSITGQVGDSSSSDDMDDNDLISQEQIETMRKKFSADINAVALWSKPVMGEANKGHNYANITAYGVNPDFSAAQNITIQHGRFLQDRDISGNRRVAVVSSKLVSNLFKNNINPIGKEIDLDTSEGTETYTIVGVYKYETSGMMSGNTSEKSIRTNLYIPISVAKETAKNQNYSQIEIQPKNVENAAALTKRLKAYMQKLYANNPKYTCSVYNEENMLTIVNSIMGTLSAAVAAIAAIALLVGGIGVMNIMLVSVTERTREIGTRKALGARSGYIRAQFIVEAVIICLIGGIIGIIVGILLAWLGDSLMKVSLVVSVPVIFVSVGFSMLIGVFFGYYPAKKASRLNPIDALRYE